MSVCKFKAYKGAAGPTEEQIKNNTMWAAQQLAKRGVDHKVVLIKSTKHGKDVEAPDDAITIRVGRYYIDFDRWGFVTTRGSDLIHDQVSDKELLHWVDKHFKKK